MPAIAGPTASGKSALALAVAERFDLEIVNADAMQVYRGMDIGTAKPTAEEQRLVRHHVIDVVTPAEPYSVTRYVADAHAAIDDVLARGKTPLVVGGTGFYIRALREGLPTTPAADAAAQAPLWASVEQGRLAELIDELAAAAPQDAERAAGNPRRVVRSLEVLRRTGRPPSAFPFTTPRFALALHVLSPPPDTLRQRVVRRALKQFESGLVEEVAGLIERYPDQPTALQAIGYKEVARHVRGSTTRPEAIEEVVSATVRYAKRQRTWFRAERDTVVWATTGEEARTAVLTGWLAAASSGWSEPWGPGH